MTTPALPCLRFVTCCRHLSRAQADPSVGHPHPGKPGDSNGEVDALLANVAVEKPGRSGNRSRGRDTRDELIPLDTRLLALEAEDGLTVFIRADALSDRLDRLADTRPSCAEPTAALIFPPFAPRCPQPGRRGVGLAQTEYPHPLGRCGHPCRP